MDDRSIFGVYSCLIEFYRQETSLTPDNVTIFLLNSMEDSFGSYSRQSWLFFIYYVVFVIQADVKQCYASSTPYFSNTRQAMALEAYPTFPSFRTGSFQTPALSASFLFAKIHRRPFLAKKISLTKLNPSVSFSNLS